MSKDQTRFISRITRNSIAIVLAGGRGSRLKNLTDWRAKPAVPFGGKFRIIDFPLSNCINSGIRCISVLTQYKAHSLIRHLQQGWGFLRGQFGEYLEIIPAQQRMEGSWYAGTADAVYQNFDIIRRHNPDHILILAGDHIYKMDYGPMLASHVSNNADMTVGCLEVPLEEAKDFGVMKINDQGQVMAFREKPDEPDPMPDNPKKAMASMGIYVFNADFLWNQLFQDANTLDSSRDFGKDIIPRIIGKHKVHSYPFRDVQSGSQAYWRDVGTVDAYWEANMELVSVTPPLNLYDRKWPIWTKQEQLPPAKFVFNDGDRRGMAVDSMVSAGCIISGCKIDRTLLFNNVRLDSFSEIKNTVILPNVLIKRHCRIKKAIIDKNCTIPENSVIGYDLEEDRKRFYVTEKGVVLITPAMLNDKIHVPPRYL